MKKICLLSIPLLLSSSPAWAQIAFTDVASTAGVETAPGILSESVAWGDYDSDGDPDLLVTNDGQNRLYRNDQEMGADQFTDVSMVTGIGTLARWSVGAAWADFDNDGDLDLYVVNFGPGSEISGEDELYRNDGPIGMGGEILFVEVSAASGIDALQTSRGTVVLDYDKDGLIDIYTVAIGNHVLYHNDGCADGTCDGSPVGEFPTFTDVAEALGVTANSQGVGAVATDINNDGWLDIYTGNRSFQQSSLFMGECGEFTDIATSAGLTAQGLGMGVHAFDYDNDLDMDLYWTTWPGSDSNPNRLYRNNNDGTFTDVAVTTGTTDVPGWGISNNAGDIDNDGWEDFYVTNGFDGGSGPNILFRSNVGGDGTFQDITTELGGGAFDGRGAAFADYNLDGNLDLVVSGDTDVPLKLYRNDTSNSNHWISLRLLNNTGNANPSPIGTRVTVTQATPMPGSNVWVKEVSGGAGRGSFNDLTLEFGVGNAMTVDIDIRWPSGGTDTYTGVAVDMFQTYLEGTLPAPDPNACACQRDVDDCDTNAACANDAGSPYFLCTCLPGYEGDGTTTGTGCTDIDECDTAADDCVAGAACSDTDGGFLCVCPTGYTGDGRMSGTGCTNLNECMFALDNCDPNASCMDTDGSFTCTCLPGYTGDGVTTGTGCADVNECEDMLDDCIAEATCSNVDGDYVCTCPAGTSGDGRTSGTRCDNLDECVLGTDDCDSNAACTNQSMGFSCECNPGYVGDGTSTGSGCTDVNECTADIDNCNINAACSNTDGAFACTCNNGFRGDGVTCSPDDGSDPQVTGGGGCGQIPVPFLMALPVLALWRRRRSS